MDLGNLKTLADSILSYINNNFIKKSDVHKVTNDLTDELKNNYDAAYSHSKEKHAPNNAEENIINSISINNKELVPDSNKNINIIIPESDLNDDDIIKMVNDVIKEIES